MKKFLSVVMALVLVFSMIPINALAVEETNIQSIEFEDTYTLGKRETSQGSVYTFSAKCTINFTNGAQEVVYVTGGEGLQESIHLSNGESYNIEFSSNDEYFGSLGDSREYIGTIQGVSDTFNVTYAGIQNIEVETVERIENWGGYPTGEWDSENQCYENQWFYYDIYPENITVTLSNGVNFSGDSEEISRRMGRNVYCNAEQSFESQWGIGEHTATISVGSYVDEYIVKVVETPIQSIEVEDLVFMPGTSGAWVTEGDRGTYWMYNTQPQKMSVTLKDGQVLEGNFNEVRQQLGLSPVVFPGPDGGVQTFDNQWGIGEHKVTIDILGYKTDYSVIIQPPIQSIEIEDVSIMEYSNGYDNGFYHSFPGLTATVTYKDGTVEHINGNLEIDGEWYWIEHNTFEAQQENPWEAGNTYEITGTLLGVSDTFNVTIVESPIKSIEIEDVSIIEGTSGSYFEGKYYYNISANGTVTFDDGETREFGKYESIEIDGQYYSVSNDAWNIQQEKSWEVGNTYEVTGTLLGASDTFNVTIAESPIKSIALEDLVLFEDIDSYSSNGFEMYHFSPVLSSVLLKDGTTADVEYSNGIWYDGEYYNVSNNSWNMQQEEHWEPGKTYTVTETLMGVSATFNVTIQENPIREIEVLKMPDKTEYLVGEYFNLKGAILLIKYNNGDDEKIVIDNECVEGFSKDVWSETLKRLGYIETQMDFQDAMQKKAEGTLFGKTFEIPVNVKENLIESVTIKENADKSITATVNNSDNTSYDMTLLDICIWWEIEEGATYAAVFTDKGTYDMAIYDSENSFAIGLGDIYTENVIKSNSLSGSEWYEIVEYFDNFCSSILPGNDNVLNFNGKVTKDNIDRVIATAFYMGYSWEDDELAWKGDYATISGERVRESLAKYFALENVDLTLSECYDAQSDTYELFDYIRSSWMKTRPYKINYSNGIWSMKVTYLSDDGEELSTYLKLNDEKKILSYSVNATYMAGDINDDNAVTDADALYLLYHTIFGESYPIEQDCDYNKDGAVTDADALYLLYHTIFGDSYPLN